MGDKAVPGARFPADMRGRICVGLAGVDRSGVDLTDADISDAFLGDATLSGCKVSREQLDSALTA